MCMCLCMGMCMCRIVYGFSSEFGIAKSKQKRLDRYTLFVCEGSFVYVYVCVCMGLYVCGCMYV